MPESIRYQAAIVQNDHILLIKCRRHRSGRDFWAIPGGGREVDESEEECVRREVKEETRLDVCVEGLILDAAIEGDGVYDRLKTYACRPTGGVPRPGYEPEPEAASLYAIIEVGWFDLRDESTWDDLLVNYPIMYPSLQRIRRVLGYL
jgi:8-oxo-dGTP pyrophosphatase MutT (NUDIX family)